jgi:DNA-binding PucR family transcriptional regulator
MRCAHALVLVSAVDAVADADSAVTRAAVEALLGQFPNAVEVPITWAVTAHATIAVPVTSPAWATRASVLRGVTAAHTVHLFVTAPAARVASLRCAYERATALLRVVRAVSTVPGVVSNADMRLYHLAIEGASDHQSYLDEVLGPILRQPVKQRDRLLETLVALRNTSLRGGMRAAARALGVHEKTVACRTERIVELTGLDPDNPHQRAQLIVAVDLLALQGWTPSRVV